MKKALITLLGLACLLALGIGLNVFLEARAGAPEDAEDAGSTDRRPLPVEIETLDLQESFLVQRRFTGTVVARRAVNLSFEGSGRVERVAVDEGASVATGDVLAELDVELLGAERARTASSRVPLQARLDELINGPRKETIAAARADLQALEEELSLAQLQRDRRAELVEKGTVSREQLETLAASVDTLTARRSASEARLSELENGTREETLAAQRGALAEVDAALAAIDVQISRSKLVAPFDGQIELRALDEGAVVSSMMPQTAFRLIETSALEARIGIPPHLASQLQEENAQRKVLVRGNAIGTDTVRLLPTVDAATRTVTVIFDLESVGAGQVRPGDVCTLELEVPRREAGAWVPLAALSESRRGLWSVYGIVSEPQAEDTSNAQSGSDRKAADSPLTVDRLEVEVLHVAHGRAFVRGTFDGGERYVSSGAHRLVPGQPVVDSQR